MATSTLAGYCTEGGITTKHNFWGGCSRHSWLWQVNRIRRITIPRPPMQDHYTLPPNTLTCSCVYCSFSQTVGRACEGVDVGETVAFQVEITLSTCTEQLRREARQRWALTMLMCLLWPSLWLLCQLCVPLYTKQNSLDHRLSMYPVVSLLWVRSSHILWNKATSQGMARNN